MTLKPSLSPELPTDLDKNRLPQHVAVIMDGNGRWAKSRGLPRIMGHQRGVDALKDLLRCCRDWGIPALTAYAFSTENWGRPLEEVEFLMTLFERVLRREYSCVDCSRTIARNKIDPQTNRKAAEDVWNLHMTRSLDMDW